MCERLSSASKNTISFSVSFSVAFLLLFLPLDPFDPLDPLTRWVELIQKSWTTRVRVLNVRLVSRGFSDCTNGSRMTPSERRLQRREQTASFATNCIQSARGVSRFFWPSRIVPSGPRAQRLSRTYNFQRFSKPDKCLSKQSVGITDEIYPVFFSCVLFSFPSLFSLSSQSRTKRVKGQCVYTQLRTLLSHLPSTSPNGSGERCEYQLLLVQRLDDALMREYLRQRTDCSNAVRMILRMLDKYM